MTPDRRHEDDALVRLVESHLGVGVTGATPLAGASPRSIVLRLTLVEPIDGATTVVVKQVRVAEVVNQPSGAAARPLAVGSEAEREATARYSEELAAYERLGRARCRAVPTLVAALVDHRSFVLEDVSGRDVLDEVWTADQGRAEEALVAMAVALAEVHAAGMDPDVAPSSAELDAAAAPTFSSVRTGAAQLARATGAGGDGWVAELAGVADRLRAPGSFATWLHGDPCPAGNVLLGEGRARLVDLEAARPGHAVLEAAFFRSGFPTCWSVWALRPEALRSAEDAYRRTLAPMCSEITDDATWRIALGDACAWWALDGDALVQRAERGSTTLVGNALDRDWVWGTATARQRLRLRLEQASATMASAGHAPALTALLRAAGDHLTARGAPAAPSFPTLLES